MEIDDEEITFKRLAKTYGWKRLFKCREFYAVLTLFLLSTIYIWPALAEARYFNFVSMFNSIVVEYLWTIFLLLGIFVMVAMLNLGFLTTGRNYYLKALIKKSRHSFERKVFKMALPGILSGIALVIAVFSLFFPDLITYILVRAEVNNFDPWTFIVLIFNLLLVFFTIWATVSMYTSMRTSVDLFIKGAEFGLKQEKEEEKVKAEVETTEVVPDGAFEEVPMAAAYSVSAVSQVYRYYD